MAKKTKKKTKKSKTRSTDWRLGQPLDFPPTKNPTDLERILGEAVEEAKQGPNPKREKRKKK